MRTLSALLLSALVLVVFFWLAGFREHSVDPSTDSSSPRPSTPAPDAAPEFTLTPPAVDPPIATSPELLPPPPAVESSSVDTPAIEARSASVEGRVVGDDGAPVAAITVSLKRAYPTSDTVPGPWREDDTYTYGPGSPDVLSDSDGRFRIADLESANYAVNVEGDGYSQVTTRYFFLEPGEHRSGIEVRVGVGEVMAGTIANSRGKPIADAYVTVQELPHRYPRTRARTDENGKWFVRGLRSAPQEVTAFAFGYTPEIRNDIPLGETDSWIELHPTGSLTVFVTDAVTRRPVPEFFVRLQLETLAEQRRRRLSSTLDFGPGERVESVHGEWRKDDLQHGPYTLTVSARGYMPRVHTDLYVAAEGTTDGVRTVELELDPGLVIQGRVVDDRKQPVVGARVQPDDGYGMGANFGGGLNGPPTFVVDEFGSIDEWDDRSITDDSGEFELRGLPRNLKAVSIRHPEFRDRLITLPTEESRSNPLVIPPVTVSRGESIEGTVIIPADLEFSHGSVEIFDAKNHMMPFHRYSLDETGQYRFGGLAPGTYSLHAKVTLRKPRARIEAISSVEIREHQDLRHDLVPE